MRQSARIARLVGVGLAAVLVAPAAASARSPASHALAPVGVAAATPSAGNSTATPSRILLTPTTTPATSQRVSWTMPRRQAGQRVQYRKSGGAIHTVAATRGPATSAYYSGSSRPRYAATLTGLVADTSYQYRIVTKRAKTAWRSFTTAGGAGEPTTIVALGDTQVANRGVPRATIRAALAAEPDADLLLQAGDGVDRPYLDSQWADLFAAIGSAGRTRNWVASIGNHEQCVLLTKCRSKQGQAFRSYFDWPSNGFPRQGQTWFWLDYQDVRIVVLDTFGGRLADQARFLDEALASNPNRWSIVLMHTPPFATRPGRTNDEVRATLLPIVEARGVDLVLTGHDHSYARGQRSADGTVFAVSVSGPKYYPWTDADWVAHGADRQVWAGQTSTYQAIRIDGDRLDYRAVVTAKGVDSTTALPIGGVLDHFTITKKADGDRVVR